MGNTKGKSDLFGKLRFKLSTPWIRTVIYISLVLIVPEYIAPVFSILALIAALRDTVASKRKLFAGTSSEPMVLIFILLAAGLIISPNKFSTLQSIGLWFSACMIYISLVSVITTRRRLERTIWAFTVAISLNGIIALLQFFIRSTLGFDIHLAFWRYFDESFLKLFGKQMYYFIGERASSTFCNPNVFAESMAMLLPFALYYSCSHRKDLRHNISRILVPIAFIGTMFSFSRGVYLALIIVLLVYSLYHIKKLRFILIAAVIVILLIPPSVYARLLSINEVREFIHSVITDLSAKSVDYEGSLLDYIITHMQSILTKGVVEESSRLRFDTWLTTIGLIAEKPVFGYGSGYVTVRDIIMSAGVTVFNTHNFFLQTLMEGGFALLAAFLWLLGRTVKKGMYVLRRSSSPKLGLSIECFVTVFLVTGLTDIPTNTPKTMYSFIMGIAIAEAAFGLYYERRPVPLSSSFPTLGKLIPKAKLKKDKPS